MTNEELINKLSRYPKDAEVMLVVGDAEDYIPIAYAGYAPGLNKILIDPHDLGEYEYLVQK